MERKIMAILVLLAASCCSVQSTCREGQDQEQNQGSKLGRILGSVGCAFDKGIKYVEDGAKHIGQSVHEKIDNKIQYIKEAVYGGESTPIPPPSTPSSDISKLIDIRGSKDSLIMDIFDTSQDQLPPGFSPNNQQPTEATMNPETLDSRILIKSPRQCKEGQQLDKWNVCRDVSK